MTAETPDPWQHVLPPSIETASPAQLTIPVHVPHGATVVMVVADHRGHEEFLTQVEDNSPPREVDGVLTGRARFALGELQPGQYTLRASMEDGTEASSELVVTAPAAGEAPEDDDVQAAEETIDETPTPEESTPEESEPSGRVTDEAPEEETTEEEDDAVDHAGVGREEYGGRNWGVSATLYAMRSIHSWGVGDLADLADLAVTVADAGGDYVLLTPIARNASDEIARLGFTAAERGGLVIDPLHVRPEDIREVAYLPSSQRTMLEWGSETIRATNTESEPIDFPGVWEAKRTALEVIYSAKRSSMREASFQRFVRDHGHSLAEYVHAAVAAEAGEGESLFADLCADSTTGAAARREHNDRIYFYLWLQWTAREQLARAHKAARVAGMRIGLVHTAPAAADPQIIEEIGAYAGGVFLTEASGGGVEQAAESAATAGVLLFADGRDTDVRERLVSLGVIPQTTLWAEFDGETPRDLGGLPRQSMIAVTTTQNPPTAGFLTEEHLALMNRLELLHEPYEEVRKAERIIRERLMDKVRQRSLITEGATERQLIEGLHRYLAFSPSQFLTLTLSDAVGNRRPFTLGGTYPDWTYPYTDGAGASVLVDELNENARFNSLLGAVDNQLRGE